MLPKDSTAGRRRCKMALVTIRAFGVVLTDPPTRCFPASPAASATSRPSSTKANTTTDTPSPTSELSTEAGELQGNFRTRHPSTHAKKRAFHFCPDCGATVFYTLATAPDVVAVPIGAFADPPSRRRGSRCTSLAGTRGSR